MWYNKYIGLPYKDNGRTTAGIDCWGLACLVYREHFDIELPTLDDHYQGAQDLAVRELVNNTKESWILTTEPKAGDICVFNILGEPTHVGIYIGDRKFLHARAGQDSVIESLDSVGWSRRLEGVYEYNHGTIQLTGAPHPLQLQNVVTDWAAAGTSIGQLTKYIQEKYRVSARLLERIVIVVDGIPIAQENWQTTKLLPGQTVAYRVIAAGGGGGNNPLRTLLTLAVVIAVAIYAPQIGAYLAGPGASTAAIAGYTAATSIALNMAGMALINAIAPIKTPKPEIAGTSLNLFNGSSNQINRFGAVPVVLGRVRMTGVHGATPYIEGLRDTSVISMALIWGFGPLKVSDIQIGLVPIEQFYGASPSGATYELVPVTLSGYPGEDITSFDQIYGKDVTQQIVNTDLVNDYYLGTDGTNNRQTTTNPPETSTNPKYLNPDIEDAEARGLYITGGAWKEVALTEPCTRIELTFTFPQGLRSLKAPNEVAVAVAKVEVQYKTQGSAWSNVPIFTNSRDVGITANAAVINGSRFLQQRPTGYSLESNYYITYNQTYQWHIITLKPGGGLSIFSGTETESPFSVPSSAIKDSYTATQYNSLAVSTSYLSATYNNIPEIPSGHIELYRVCLRSARGINQSILFTQVDMRSAYGTVTGLQLTKTENADGTIYMDVSSGYITNTTNTPNAITTVQEKFTTQNFSNSGIQNILYPTGSSNWSEFLRSYGVWASSGVLDVIAGREYKIATLGNTNWQAFGAPANATIGTIFTATTTANSNNIGSIPGTVYKTTVSMVQSWTVSAGDDGWYTVYVNSTNIGSLYLDGKVIFNFYDDSYNTEFNNTVYVGTGTHQVQIFAFDDTLKAPNAAVAVRFSITKDGLNSPNVSNSTILSWGELGTGYQLWKDAFNTSFSIDDLPPALYTVRVRRYNYSYGGQVPESPEWSGYNKCSLYTVTGYSNNKPITNPPGCYLAKTAIRMQSTNKVNGTVDGINALVETLGYDVVYTNNNNTKTWTPNLPINNPASLFRYVLQHPANMYAVPDGDIDLEKLVEWHKFCFDKKLTYNNVITNTQSVMDTLREICAAGLASPTLINGKWSVVVDKPRDYVTQHFTPHNSWGFESTKALPKIPDAFRVTINNEDKAFQPDEFFVFKDGITSNTAKIYEQLSLPGVTNKDQATYLAKWHFAQLKLRPETYKLNVDFEYLVCTRGDLVRVSHDIPQWGTASGRITSIVHSSEISPGGDEGGLINYMYLTTITLSEQVYLDTAKIYCIRFRRNSKTFYTLGIRNLIRYQTGYTNTIIIQDNLTNAGLEVDNLFMIGEIVGDAAKDSQQLVVLSIEPTSNTSAVLTLTDYSPQIYAEGFTNLVYDPQITGSNNDVIVNSITDAPFIQDATSDSAFAELISPGIYTNILTLSISHPNTLTQTAQKVEVQYVEATASLDNDSSGNSITVDKSTGAGIEIRGLVSGKGYKFRARYLNNTGTIRGPWSTPPLNAVVVGKRTNSLVPPNITVDLDGYYLVITPSDSTVSKDDIFKTFEFRVYKSSGSTAQDFWDLGTTLSTIKFVQSRSASRVDLRTFDQPRISEAGVQYRVACRVLDTNNNYSSTSTLTSFTLKTIVEEDPEDT